MSENITVRNVTKEDLPSLRERERMPEEHLADLHFKEAEQGDCLFFVAIKDDEPLGTAILDLHESDYKPRLRNMWVYPNARRMGAGRALSNYAESMAEEMNFPAIYLAVDPNNEKAIPLYVSLDYYPIGEHLFMDDPDLFQVADPSMVSDYYAVYKKSLLESE